MCEEAIKICTNCGNEKPITNFIRIKRHGKYYRVDVCYECREKGKTEEKVRCDECERLVPNYALKMNICAFCWIKKTNGKPLITVKTPVMIFEDVLQSCKV